MSERILVVVEQREGKLNRVSWETLVAGQSIAAETGWALEAAVAGSGVAAIAGEIAAKKVEKVYGLESPALDPYTPDAFSAASSNSFRPNSQAGADAAYLPGAGFRSQTGDVDGADGDQRRDRISQDGGKLLFTRQMFQGKFAADVSFSCDAPWFVTFQNGAFRADKVEAGASAAPVETVNAGYSGRHHPQ